mmetsp:Transcript_14168/g.34957  ORF Transcript_14168/g.34957 Transcript_14168/m.34957 type:complete len:208 (+) Transcript_14168:2932-3555(+)
MVAEAGAAAAAAELRARVRLLQPAAGGRGAARGGPAPRHAAPTPAPAAPAAPDARPHISRAQPGGQASRGSCLWLSLCRLTQHCAGCIGRGGVATAGRPSSCDPYRPHPRTQHRRRGRSGWHPGRGGCAGGTQCCTSRGGRGACRARRWDATTCQRPADQLPAVAGRSPHWHVAVRACWGAAVQHGQPRAAAPGPGQAGDGVPDSST